MHHQDFCGDSASSFPCLPLWGLRKDFLSWFPPQFPMVVLCMVRFLLLYFPMLASLWWVAFLSGIHFLVWFEVPPVVPWLSSVTLTIVCLPFYTLLAPPLLSHFFLRFEFPFPSSVSKLHLFLDSLSFLNLISSCPPFLPPDILAFPLASLGHVALNFHSPPSHLGFSILELIYLGLICLRFEFTGSEQRALDWVRYGDIGSV